MQLPPWPEKVNPVLQRTVWISAIILTVLKIIMDMIIQYINLFKIFMSLAFAAWIYNSWNKNRGMLLAWWTQYYLISEFFICLLSGSLFFWSKRDGYSLLVCSAWLLTGLTWMALSMWSAHEKDKLLWRLLAQLVDRV